ncbi:MAG: hypothetical protein WC843_04325 [Candidatus Gracilibacteria bacterium]|jgi:hypothetical protein
MKHESVAQNAPNHEEAYLNELVEVTAKKAVKAHDNSERFNELIEDAQNEAESYGAASGKIYDRVMAKVVDLEAKARSKRDSEAIKQYKGRVILIDKKYRPANDNGQYGTVGDDEKDPDEMEDDEKKKRLSHAPAGLHKKTKVTVKNRLLWRNKRLDVQELDELMKQVEEKEAEIRKYELRIKLLKVSQKNTRKLAKDMAGFIQDSQGNWFTSGEWVRVAARSLKQEAGKHYDEKNTVKALAKAQKKNEGKKSELKMAMEEITTLQDRGLGIFKANFGSKEDPESEIGLLLANKAEMDPEEYDKDIKALRERVRKFGEKNGIIYMEYYLNQVLGIKPGVMQVMPSEANQYKTIEDKTAYTVPVDKKEIAAEKFAVAKRWKEFFGTDPLSGEVEGLIMKLRNNNTEFLNWLRKDPNVDLPKDDPDVIVLKFLFTGKLDGKKGALNEDFFVTPINPDNILKVVKEVEKYMQKGKGGSVDELNKYFEDLMNISQQSAAKKDDSPAARLQGLGMKGMNLITHFDYLKRLIDTSPAVITEPVVVEAPAPTVPDLFDTPTVAKESVPVPVKIADGLNYVPQAPASFKLSKDFIASFGAPKQPATPTPAAVPDSSAATSAPTPAPAPLADAATAGKTTDERIAITKDELSKPPTASKPAPVQSAAPEAKAQSSEPTTKKS